MTIAADPTSIEQLRHWVQMCDNVLMNLQITADESVDEAARFITGAEALKLTGLKALSTLYKYENEMKDFPAPHKDEEGNRLGHTIDQIHQIQRLLGTGPGRKEGDPTLYIASANQKGGCQKSTNCQNVGAYAAYLGYKVLIVDIDPQASITLHLGYLPDKDIGYYDTVGPYLHGEFEIEVVEDGETRLLPLPELESVIKHTNIHGMDVLPASLHLGQVENSLTSTVVQAYNSDDHLEAQEVFHRLRTVLQEVEEDYDLIIVDGTPSLGILPLNLLTAADVCIVPVPTEIPDFASTRSFLELLADYLESYQTMFNQDLPAPELLFLPTKFGGNTSQTRVSKMINRCLKEIFETNAIQTAIMKHDAAIGLAQTHKVCPFSTDFSKLPSLTRTVERKRAKDQQKRLVENLEMAYSEILERAIGKRWPSRIAELEAKGVVV